MVQGDTDWGRERGGNEEWRGERGGKEEKSKRARRKSRRPLSSTCVLPFPWIPTTGPGMDRSFDGYHYLEDERFERDLLQQIICLSTGNRSEYFNSSNSFNKFQYNTTYQPKSKI